MAFYDKEYIAGNMYGQILKDNDVLMMDKKNQQNPIVSINKYDNKIICETAQKAYIVSDINYSAIKDEIS